LVKALHIYNNKEISAELQDIFSQIDVNVVSANSTRQGMKILESDLYIDMIIITEIQEEDDLCTFLSAVKNMPRFECIPVLLIASSINYKDIAKYYKLGVCDFLSLPVTPTTLSEKIGRAVLNGKPTILIADDDELILDLLKNILEIERFNVLKAANGKEALKLLETSKVDVVISDILMPEMTGLELLVEVKKRFDHIPILMITGFSGNYSINDVIDAGADGYFAKPFKNTELVKKIRVVIEKYKTNDNINMNNGNIVNS